MTISPARLWRCVGVPTELRARATVDGDTFEYGGDVRLGDLDGDGGAELLVYRSLDDAHDGGGMKPVFLGAFDLDGVALWTQGGGGVQPSRPGPVLVHDVDGDGAAEVVCLFRHATRRTDPDHLGDVVVQVRDGRDGTVRREAAPPALTACRGRGPNWVHQRLLACDLRGTGRARDAVIKLGATTLALDLDTLQVLWTHECAWTEYTRCPSYIPAVGDIDGDGRDEVLGGYWLLDEDGTPLWEEPLARNMDSVVVTPWDGGTVRAVCSGGGHVVDAAGRAVLKLGEAVVPHGQEVRVAPFAGDDEPLMVIRHEGHDPRVLVVDTAGAIVARTTLNAAPNNTGMEPVFWEGAAGPARLYNGGRLWDPLAGRSIELPGLPPPSGRGRMGWHHCIAADVCGDAHEEVVLYDPWTAQVFIYTAEPLDEAAYGGYRPTARQVNPRLMD